MDRGLIRQTASQQLAQRIHQRIMQGVWNRGDTLPPMRDLAVEYRVSLTTVQKAMQDLQDQEVIQMRPRQAAVVTQDVVPAPERKQIGVLLGLDPHSTLPQWWRDRIVYYAQSMLTESGFQLSVFHYWQHEPDQVGQLIKSVSPVLDSLAGVFFFSFPSEVGRGIAAYFDSVDIPWMTINPVDLGTRHNFVMADHLAGGRTVGECFVRLGYQRILILHDDLESVSPLEKVTGICQAYLHHDQPLKGIDVLRCADMDLLTGYEATRKYLRENPPPQGVFATADTLSIGAIRACQEHGLHVPGDVGIVGSTGVPASELRSDPLLTDLRQPVEEIGRQLGLCLLEMIRGGIRRISGRRVPSPVVLNDSLLVSESLQREIGLERFADSNGNLLSPSSSKYLKTHRRDDAVNAAASNA